MFYLVLQMAIFLILAALAGMAAGWSLNHLRNRAQLAQIEDIPTEEDVFAIKQRLDKCFDDNARLRRDLKSVNTQLERSTSSTDSNYATSDDDQEEKVRVLMDDLQLRDDTILALEKELELARNDD